MSGYRLDTQQPGPFAALSGPGVSPFTQKACSILRALQTGKYYYLFCAYFAILHASSLLSMMNLLPGGRLAFTIDLATLLPILLALLYGCRCAMQTRLSTLDAAVTVYLIISVTSVVLYLQPDNPSDVAAYFYGIHHFVLPISLYYGVKTFDGRQQQGLLRFVCYLNVVSVLIGIAFFYWRPDFYRDSILTEFQNAGYVVEEWQIFGRMQSYLGSTTLGAVIATTIILFTVLKLPPARTALFFPIILLGMLLTFQRGGFIAAGIGFLYAFFTLRWSPFYKYLLLPLVSLLMLAAGIAYLSVMEEDVVSRLLDKYSLESLVEGFNFEARGYGPGLSYFSDFPMGVGLGATSSVADSMGLATRGQVVDANYMRILADLGIIGLASFMAVLWAAGRAALRRENGIGWLLLFGLIAVICLGTNALDSFYISHLFWLYLGVIDTREHSGHATVHE